jgi:hypothetical protein
MKTQCACRFALVAVLLMLAAGCRVEERIAWSPDGSVAAVWMDDAVRLMDAEGRLDSPVASNVAAAAWLADGSGLVLVRQLALSSWEEAAALLPEDEVVVVEAMARGVPELMKAALAVADGDLDAVGPRFVEPLKLTALPEYVPAAIHLLRDRQPEVLKQAAQGCRDPAKLEAELSEVCTTRVTHVSVLPLTGRHAAGPARVLACSLTQIQQPRVSTAAPVLAFLHGDRLIAMPLDGGTTRVAVAEHVVGSFDWTPDGRSLAYAVQAAGPWESGAVNLARIEQRVAVDTNGAPIAGEATPLAISGSTFEPRVRSLPDGRVLFSGVATELPSSAAAARATRFYVTDPATADQNAPVVVPSTEGALPQDLAAFAPSPDGRRVAVVESGSDVVAVLDLSSGAVEAISPRRTWKSRILPAWRNADELYFAALPGNDATRPELLRWRSGDEPRAVSSGWTDESAGLLLEKPRE